VVDGLHVVQVADTVQMGAEHRKEVCALLEALRFAAVVRDLQADCWVVVVLAPLRACATLVHELHEETLGTAVVDQQTDMRAETMAVLCAETQETSLHLQSELEMSLLSMTVHQKLLDQQVDGACPASAAVAIDNLALRRSTHLFCAAKLEVEIH
jgi:hypothetical protein